jgi:hypothetical protein
MAPRVAEQSVEGVGQHALDEARRKSDKHDIRADGVPAVPTMGRKACLNAGGSRRQATPRGMWRPGFN